jgi:hypothetical protein
VTAPGLQARTVNKVLTIGNIQKTEKIGFTAPLLLQFAPPASIISAAQTRDDEVPEELLRGTLSVLLHLPVKLARGRRSSEIGRQWNSQIPLPPEPDAVPP